jgi:hypothetical protein
MAPADRLLLLGNAAACAHLVASLLPGAISISGQIT